MRFLLKPTRTSVANISQTLASNTKKAAAASAPTAAAASASQNVDVGSSGKAWGQQCSPNCGCVLRIEAELSECSSASSPTIVKASYHAKRVMVTATTTNSTSHTIGLQLQPLTTQHSSQSQSSRPILSSCTCPTLHQLAQQTVDHLPGKTLAQMRNEIDMGLAGSRSSVAFRHTVLREKVLPMLEAANNNKLGMKSFEQLGKNAKNMKKDASNGIDEMNSTQPLGNCYDLVEDSLMSMIYERMPNPRKDDSVASSYSPTLGSHFRMYSESGRNQPIEEAIGDTMQQDEISFDEVGDWQRQSPSSYFLFGEEEGKNATETSKKGGGSLPSISGMVLQLALESMNERIFGNGNEAERPDASTEESVFVNESAEEEYSRPATTYLQMLDMYGNEYEKEEVEEGAVDDWLEHVDQMHSREDRPYTA